MIRKAEAKDGGLNARISQLIDYAYGKRDNHRGDEYIDTVCVSIILTRRFDGFHLTYKRSHETDYDCTYTHYIYDEKLDLLPCERDILKEAFKGKPMEEYERSLI